MDDFDGVADDRDEVEPAPRGDAAFGEDVGDFAQIERVAKRMVDELMAKVRADGKRVRTMTVKVRYPDFTQESHGCSLATATDLEAPFYPLVAPLL